MRAVLFPLSVVLACAVDEPRGPLSDDGTDGAVATACTPEEQGACDCTASATDGVQVCDDGGERFGGQSTDELALDKGEATIVGGQPATNAALVRIVGNGSCMGTLVAPDVVLSAKHCVAPLAGGGPFECDENGELVVDPDAPVVYAGAGEFGEVLPAETFSIGSSTYGSHVVEIFVSSGDTICESDTALLRLDRPVDDGEIAPLRLDHPVEVGETLTVNGYGQYEGGDRSEDLLGRSVTVVGIGPEPPVPNVSEPVPPGFFSTTEGPCRGDSGSAAFAASGAAVGVASFVGRPDLDTPSGTYEDCVGSRTQYDATATQAAFIEATLASLGATPWREGDPDPRADLSLFDDPCDVDTDCRSGVCVTHGDDQSRCSQGCLSGPCPDGYACQPIDERMRCLWQLPPQPPADAPPPDAGCATAAPHRGGPLLSLVVLAALARRRGKWIFPT